jgi:two-component system response regulator NreC
MTSAPIPSSSADARLRVLCVDDNTDFANLFANILCFEEDMTSAGTLTSADDLEAAVERHKAQVVLLDLTMPGRPPFEALASLARLRPDVAIVAFSGFDDDETRERVLKAGARGLISKSVDPHSVVATIRALCRRP